MASVSATEKLPGGKLVTVSASLGPDGAVSGVRITGDFFLHPEEGISLLEAAADGLPAGFDAAELERKLARTAEDEGLVLIGVTPASIAGLLKKAVGGTQEAGK